MAEAARLELLTEAPPSKISADRFSLLAKACESVSRAQAASDSGAASAEADQVAGFDATEVVGYNGSSVDGGVDACFGPFVEAGPDSSQCLSTTALCPPTPMLAMTPRSSPK